MPARAAAKKPSIVCAGPTCKVRFTPQRATAKYHAAACREAARRARSKAEAPAKKTAAKKSPAKASAKKAEPDKARVESAVNRHDLVVALRKELESAEALDTFEGQLALELAKRLVAADSPASSLADKVRDARARALEQAEVKPPSAGGDDPDDEEDEVTRARKQREESRQAAGLP